MTSQPPPRRTPTPRDPGRTPWAFPHVDSADAHGVVGVGADLEPATMVTAYRRGIFPWPHDDQPLPWFSPSRRAVFELRHDDDQTSCGVRVSRSLRRTLRRSGWTTTIDHAFDEVVDGCRDRPGEGTWITDGLAAGYGRLAALGWAHTIEVWDEDKLVGGLLGLLVGGVFTGESMFHRADDASKVAMVDLARRLADAGAVLLDAQIMTDHLRRMGAVELARAAFVEVLDSHSRPVHVDVESRPVARLV